MSLSREERGERSESSIEIVTIRRFVSVGGERVALGTVPGASATRFATPRRSPMRGSSSAPAAPEITARGVSSRFHDSYAVARRSTSAST